MSNDLTNVFTKRQRAILQAIVDGYTTRQEIAQHLGVAPATVRNHLTTIYDKAGVRRLPELQRELQRMGWKETRRAGERVPVTL
jgi:DNA-binding NarL/FixJ family response regulator